MQSSDNQKIHIVEKKEVLLKVISNLVGIVTRKSTIAYLAHVEIEVAGNKIKFTTTDNEISISQQIVCENVKNPGSLTVDALKLYEIIKKLPNNLDVELKTENHNLLISNGDIRFSLPFLDAEFFPSISEEDKKYEITFSKHELNLLLEKIKFAVSNENIRPNLNGIYLESSTDKITSAATDAHRLALAEIEKKVDYNFSFIIPKKTVNEIVKLASQYGSIMLSLHGDSYVTRIKVYTENIQIISKLIAGSFPNFKNVIPTKFKFSLKLNRKSLIASIERVSIVSSEQSKSIKFQISNGEVSLSATNGSDSSFAYEKLSCETDITENLEIHFNYTYLLDALNSVDDEYAEVFLNNPNSQVIMKDASNKELIYVIMPMSI